MEEAGDPLPQGRVRPRPEDSSRDAQVCVFDEAPACEAFEDALIGSVAGARIPSERYRSMSLRYG